MHLSIQVADMDVVAVVLGAASSILHLAPLSPRLRLLTLDVPDPLFPDHIHNFELLMVFHDPFGHCAALRRMRLDHEVQRPSLTVLTWLVCIAPDGMHKAWELLQDLLAACNHIWSAFSFREIHALTTAGWRLNTTTAPATRINDEGRGTGLDVVVGNIAVVDGLIPDIVAVDGFTLGLASNGDRGCLGSLVGLDDLGLTVGLGAAVEGVGLGDGEGLCCESAGKKGTEAEEN